jgi:hypothetical protein
VRRRGSTIGSGMAEQVDPPSADSSRRRSKAYEAIKRSLDVLLCLTREARRRVPYCATRPGIPRHGTKTGYAGSHVELAYTPSILGGPTECPEISSIMRLS